MLKGHDAASASRKGHSGQLQLKTLHLAAFVVRACLFAFIPLPQEMFCVHAQQRVQRRKKT
eukprot:scaffold173280_cov14-Tisochrysis_lutea.AAC.1